MATKRIVKDNSLNTPIELEADAFRTSAGRSADVVRSISKCQNELQWMTGFVLKSLRLESKVMLSTGADLSSINFDAIRHSLTDKSPNLG